MKERKGVRKKRAKVYEKEGERQIVSYDKKDRQIDRQTDRETDRSTQRHSQRLTCKKIERKGRQKRQ